MTDQNINIQEELLKALSSDIEDHYEKAIDILAGEKHQEQIKGFHDVVDQALKEVENIRRQSLLYAIDVSINFYEKGFKDGVRYLSDIMGNIDEDKEKDCSDGSTSEQSAQSA